MPSDERVARVVVALGIAVSLTSSGLLAVVLVLDAPPPATTTRVLVALAATGLVAATSGTLRPSVLLANLRTGTPEVVVGTAAGGLALAVAGPRLATAVGGTGRTISLLGPVVAVALVVTVVVLGRRRPLPAVRTIHPTAAVSAVLAAFLAASAATSLLALPDAYPLSRYPMYSSPRAEGYELDQVAFTGIREDGSERTLGRSLSRAALLRLVAEEDHDALEGFARSEADRDERIVEVRVELQTIAVTEHPDPPGFEVVASEPVLTVAVP